MVKHSCTKAITCPAEELNTFPCLLYFPALCAQMQICRSPAVSKGIEKNLEEIRFPPRAGGFPQMRFSEALKWAHLISGYFLRAVLWETVFNSNTDTNAFVSGYTLKDSITKWMDFVLSTCHTASSTSCKLVHIKDFTTSTSPFLPFRGDRAVKNYHKTGRETRGEKNPKEPLI